MIAASADTIREWVLLVATVLLAIFTFFLFKATRDMAKATADAATQAAASTKVSADLFVLESARWEAQQQAERESQAQLVELIYYAAEGATFMSIECNNRSAQAIAHVTMSFVVDGVPIGGDDADLAIKPGDGTEWRPQFEPLRDYGSIVGYIEFTDARRRRWRRDITDELTLLD